MRQLTGATQNVLQRDRPVNGVVLAGEESLIKNQRRPRLAACRRKFVSGLYRLYILGLPPLGALDHIELYLLAFL